MGLGLATCRTECMGALWFFTSRAYGRPRYIAFRAYLYDNTRAILGGRVVTTSSILGAYLKNEAALKRFLRRFVKAREDVDDLAQEAFVRAFAAESERSIESPKAFLFKTARNLALNELARQATAKIEPLGDSDELTVLVDSDQVPIDDAMDDRERGRQLAMAIADLPPQCAKVFILRKMQGLSQKEIATRLNISVRTVENHVAHGLVRCRAFFRAQGWASGAGRSSDGKIESVPTAFVRVEKE